MRNKKAIYYTEKEWDNNADESYNFDDFYCTVFDGAFDMDEEDYLRIKRIEHKTKMPYDEFLQLDILEQMRLYKILDLYTPSEKAKNELNKRIDSLGCPNKLDRKLERDIKIYEVKEKVKKLVNLKK